MKAFVATIALAALVAVPALSPAAQAQSPNEVIVNGKRVGADPDPNVRLQLRRDAGSEGY